MHSENNIESILSDKMEVRAIVNRTCQNVLGRLKPGRWHLMRSGGAFT